MTDTEFFQLQPLAIFGVSSSGKGFGAATWQELDKRGLRVLPINPRGGQINGRPILKSLTEAAAPVRAAVILTKGQGALQAVEECSRNGVEWIWLQSGSDTPAIRRRCAELKLKTLRGQCLLLRQGGFPHSVHRFFYDLLGKKMEVQVP